MLKLRTQLIAILLIVGLVPVLVVGWVSLQTSQAELQEAYYSHLETAAQSRANHIETFLEENKDAVVSIGAGIGESGLFSLDKNSEEYVKLKNRIGVRLIGSKHKEYQELFLLDLNGIVVFSTDESQEGVDKSQDDYFINGKEETYIKDAYFSGASGKESIAISSPLKDESENLVGIVVARIETTSLNEITSDRTGLRETGEIYMINKESYMITPSRFREDTFLTQKVDTINVESCFLHKVLSKEEIIENHKEVSVFQDYRGVNVLGTYVYIPEMDWCLLAEIDEAEAMAGINETKFKIFLMTGLFAIFALFVAFIYANMLSKPIKKLTADVNEITKGKLDIQLPKSKIFEIQKLTDSLNRILASLKLAILKTGSSGKDFGLGGAVEAKEKAEGELKVKEKETQDILDAVPAWIFYKDRENRFLRVNKAFANVMKLPREKLEGKSCFELYPKAQAEAFWKDDKEVIASGKSKLGIIEPMDSPTGKIWVKTDKILYRDDKGEVIGIIGFSVDISEQKKLEEKLKVGVKKVARKKVNKSVGKK
ncbi:PAS domain-containing protein [Methanococcoides sp. SA1]|nr:PAS domain-containing protein [Methanococcoides sp. SA1]